MSAPTQAFSLNGSAIIVTPALEAFAVSLDSVRRTGGIGSITITGYASPEGNATHNSRLALRRAEAMKGFFQSRMPLSDRLFTVSSGGEDWMLLRSLVGRDFPATISSRIGDIIDTTPDLERRESLLRAMDGGAVWSRLTAGVFPLLRRASMNVLLAGGDTIAITIDSTGATDIAATHAQPDTVIEVVIPEPRPVEAQATDSLVQLPTETSPLRHWYLKTNIPAYAMLWANIQAEIDGAPHWSFMLPIYYSGWNYFTSTRKYRTFTVLPEARYWFRPDNDGFFVGVHAGFCYYNVAFGGAKRYQDHNKRTPALGGGLNAGYRMNLRSDGRWKLEFSLGAGVYSLDYDTFVNRTNGLRNGRNKKTFVGIDNAAVSVCYTFDIKKKGGAE